MVDPASLRALDLFRDLTEAEAASLAERFERRIVPGGEALLREGDPAQRLHIVLSGRLAISRGGGPLLTSIGRGEPVGEVAFFGGGTRTADAIATRDSEVLSIARADFDAVADAHPALWRAVTVALSGRLAAATKALPHGDAALAAPRTLVVAPAGKAALPERFVADLVRAVEALGTRCRALDAIPGEDAERVTAQEATCDLLLLVVGSDADDWARLAVRQADAALIVAPTGTAEPPGPVEALIEARLRPSDIRLVATEGLASPWLATRQAGAVSMGAEPAPIARYITGRARGLVLGGGGALGGAHVGLYFALREAGIDFEHFGGTSVGAAIAAALALGLDRREIVERCTDIFLTNRSLRRWTLPRYSLVDPATVDRMLRLHYGQGLIEDMPRAFFGVGADLSDGTAFVMRRGPLWQAVRASCSIPALLPPMVDEAGRILVDGGIVDNLPIDPMRAVKVGPNVAIVLGAANWRRAAYRYEDLPGRGALMRGALTPWRRTRHVRAPRLGQVLTRSILLASDEAVRRSMAAADAVFEPPLPKGMGIMAWNRFAAHEQASYDWARAEIERCLAADPQALDAFR